MKGIFKLFHPRSQHSPAPFSHKSLPSSQSPTLRVALFSHKSLPSSQSPTLRVAPFSHNSLPSSQSPTLRVALFSHKSLPSSQSPTLRVAPFSSLLIALTLLLTGCSRDFTNPWDPDVAPGDWSPAQTRLTVLNQQSVQLHWQHSGSGDISAIIERSVDNSDFQELFRTSELTFVDSSLEKSRSYAYRIRSAIETRSSDPAPAMRIEWQEGGQSIWQYQMPANCSAADLSSDGSSLALGDENGRLIVLNTDRGEPAWSLQAAEKSAETDFPSILDLHFSPDHSKLAGSTFNALVFVADVEKGTLDWKKSTESSTTQIPTLSFSRDGSQLASGGYDKVLRLWNASTGDQLWGQYTDHFTSFVEKVLFSTDNAFIYACGWDSRLRKYDRQTGATLAETTENNREVWDLALSPDDQYIAAASFYQLSRFETASLSLSWTADFSSQVLTVDYASDGNWVAGACNGSIRILNAHDGSLFQDITLSGFVHKLQFSPDARFLASADRNGQVILHHVDTGKPIWQYTYSNEAEFLEFSSDGNYLFSATRDGQVNFLVAEGTWVQIDE